MELRLADSQIIKVARKRRISQRLDIKGGEVIKGWPFTQKMTVFQKPEKWKVKCVGCYLQIINFRRGLSNAWLARHLQNTWSIENIWVKIHKKINTNNTDPGRLAHCPLHRTCCRQPALQRAWGFLQIMTMLRNWRYGDNMIQIGFMIRRHYLR